MSAQFLMSTTRIEPATLEDCDLVAELHVAAWRVAYKGLLPTAFLATLSVESRAFAWRKVLQEGRSELLLARSDDGVIGFVSFGPCRDDDAPPGRGEIWSIYLYPRHWSTGVGRTLWLAAHERLVQLRYSSISLWVIVGNERAKRFYRKAGFEVEWGSEKNLQIADSTLREIRLIRSSSG